MTFNYTRDIPDGPHNPSSDQQPMKLNTNAIDDLLDVDHFSFNQANGGKHEQVRMPVKAAIPAGLAASEGTLYTKSVTSDASTRTQLFYSPDASGNQYQMTRTIAANFATFSTITNYTATLVGGWTFLPGGMLLQYGFLPNPTNNAVITFPVPFTTFVFPTLGAYRNNTDDKSISIKDGSVSTSQFQVILSGSSLPTGLYWQAVGK